MQMTPNLRRLALSAHVATSVGSLGAVAAFLALTIAGVKDHEAAEAAYGAMEVTAWYVVAPLILAALLTGVIQSLFTSWGLLRHYWVVAKLLLTLLVTMVLLLQMELISYVAGAAAMIVSNPEMAGLRGSLVLHAAGGLVVLITATVLSVYKPRGMTRFGWRKQYNG